MLKSLATAVLADARDQSRPPSLILESLEVNLVRQDTLKQYLDPSELTGLIDCGFLKPMMHTSGDAVLYIRLPELLASELALQLADELAKLAKTGPKAAAIWM